MLRPGEASFLNILFIHQNYPGQYREYVPALAASGDCKVAFLTQRTGLPQATDHFIGVYKTLRRPKADAWRYTRWFETTIGNAGGAAKACKILRDKGYRPDLVTGHANWGELLFVKDVWPDTRLVGLFEYYFIAKGGLVGFDPEFKEARDIEQLLFVNNAQTYLTYEKCDAGLSPTQWQLETHPPGLRGKLKAMHDGIRTDRLIPDHDSAITVACGGTTFKRGEEIVTYVARNLEPARGVHTMLRALPRLQKLRPEMRLAVVGGEGVSYGAQAPAGKTFKGMLLKELGNSVDWSRVHFLGQIPYDSLMQLIRIARCHVYLTVPFVLSWSLLEAMALEKTIVASDVAPVREVMADGKTGFLVDFFKPQDLAERIADVLKHRDNFRSIGVNARNKIVSEYDFLSVRFPAWKAYMNQFLPQASRFSL
jgi:glycosyltransferase involved in cell wall biosynthesis